MTSFPQRPDRPEFWKLAGIVSGHDAELDTAVDEVDKESRYQAMIADVVPSEVLSYVSVQRGMRAVGVVTAGELERNFDAVAHAAAVWIDGFMAGTAYARDDQEEP